MLRWFSRTQPTGTSQRQELNEELKLAEQTQKTQLKAPLWRQPLTTCNSTKQGWTHTSQTWGDTRLNSAMQALPGITTVCIHVNGMGRTKGMNKWCTDILQPPCLYTHVAMWFHPKHMDNSVTFEACYPAPETVTNACNWGVTCLQCRILRHFCNFRQCNTTSTISFFLFRAKCWVSWYMQMHNASMKAKMIRRATDEISLSETS